MTTSASRAAARCALLTTSALCAFACTAPAYAQALADTPSPVRYQFDENGVDLARGTFATARTEISIGPDGPGGLAMVRQRGPSATRGSFDFDLWGNGTSWNANVGLRSYAFSQSGSTFTSTDGTGAALVKSGAIYTLTTGDGTKVVYDYLTLATADFNRKARASAVIYTSGDRMNLHWVSVDRCTNFLDNCEGGQWQTYVRLQAVTNSAGYQLHFNYASAVANTVGQLTNWQRLNSITAINTTVEACDPTAHACTLSQPWASVSYSGGSVTDPVGRTSTYANSGGVFTIRRPSSSTPNTSVSHSAQKVTAITRDGMSWTYAYSVSGAVATMVRTDPLGHSRTIVSDINVGLPTSIKDELNRTTTYTYDTSGRLTRVTAPEGNYTQYGYDGRGNVTTTTAVAKSGSGLSNIVASAAFPASCTNVVTCNKPTSTTDARGKITDYTYDPTHGGVLTVTAPAQPNAIRPQTRYTYSTFSTPGGQTVYRPTGVSACQTTSSCIGGADEAKTTIAYAHTNRLPSSVSSGSGNGSLTAITAMTYDTRGNTISVDGPIAGAADTARAQYDLADQLLGTVSPDPDAAGALLPRATRYTYHPDGMVESVARGTVAAPTSDIATISIAERVINTYDPAGRKVQENLYDAASTTQALTQYGYDGEGRLVCTAVRMNPATFGSPAGSCVIGTTGSFGPDRITRVTYDAADQVTRVETGVGTADQRDEVANTWSSNGRLLTVTDAKSNRTTYEYDGFDRLKKTRYPLPATINASSTTDYEELTYDFGSNVVSRRLRDGQVIGFTYDNLSRAVLKDLPGTEPDVTFAHDNLGRLTQARKAAASHTIGLAYDALGRQTSESSIFGSMTYQYDLAGRRTRVTWPDAFYVTYDYLTTGEATNVRENGATALATYAYDNLGRRTGLTRSNGTSTSYGYDPISRLSSLTQNLAGTANDITLSFTYNPASQIASNTRSNDVYAWTGHGSGTAPSTPNGLNQIVSHNGSAIDYDARGNLVNDGAFTYGYTSENLLVTRSGGAALIHDPLMRLYQTNADGNTWFTLDGAEIASEHNSVGVVKRRYVRGPGMDEPIVWYEGAGASDRRFLHADERGSIIAVSDAAGNPIAINKYDEYGVPAPGNFGRFQYTGQAWMPEIGLYHYKARAYAPRLGRFMQTDPIGYGDGMNLYGYVAADPTNFADFLGTSRQNDNPPPPKKLDGPQPSPTGTRLPGGCGSCSGGTSFGPGSVPNVAAERRAFEAAVASSGVYSGVGGPLEGIKETIELLFDLFKSTEPDGLIERRPLSGPYAGTPAFWNSFSGSAEELAVMRTIIMISVGSNQTIQRQALDFRKMELPRGTGGFYSRYEVQGLSNAWRVANQPGSMLYYVTNSHEQATAGLPAGWVEIRYPERRGY